MGRRRKEHRRRFRRRASRQEAVLVAFCMGAAAIKASDRLCCELRVVGPGHCSGSSCECGVDGCWYRNGPCLSMSADVVAMALACILSTLSEAAATWGTLFFYPFVLAVITP